MVGKAGALQPVFDQFKLLFLKACLKKHRSVLEPYQFYYLLNVAHFMERLVELVLCGIFSSISRHITDCSGMRSESGFLIPV